MYGYNDIGIKVFQNGNEKNTGVVKYKTTMYHGLGGPSHTTPVKENFNYDVSTGLFKGYAVFIMYDTAAFWAADYDYNSEFGVDSAVFPLEFNSLSQILVWDNTFTQRVYILTLLSSLSPVSGLNELKVMLHETSGFQVYNELPNAEMFIRPQLISTGQGSDNNANPVYLGEGIYKGTVNFTMPGEWYVYDSVKYNGTVITKSPPPKFKFTIN
ncbi:MAG: hypothetical protein HGGPFJEG_01195 [Ignavibacteria bacterium]|nr:hypothetical protein [Ignavibacteria bacterium]